MGAPACGTLGIELEGSDSNVLDGLGGENPQGTGGISGTDPATGGADTGSGGKVHGSGGDESGGQSNSGGESSGGDSAGGDSGSGGEPASGGSDGSGGDNAGGTAGAGGSSGGGGTGGDDGAGGSGGAAMDCDASDTVCAALLAALENRYSFDGMGPAIVDSVGNKNGNAVGTSLNGSGELAFTGGDHVTLAPGLISSLPNATIEVWFEWDGGEQWQWLFGFGHKMGMSNGTSYLYVTPEAGGGDPTINALGAGIRHEGLGDRQLRTSVLTETGVLTQVVLVVSDTANRLSLYKNGVWLADRDTDVDLGGIDDDTNRLGASLIQGDPPFEGTITEFRIYGDVLTAEMIQKSFDLGPDTTFAP